MKELSDEMALYDADSRYPFTVIFDRIDDAWDGSDKAVVLVTAMMHACVELVHVQSVRPLLFLRENVFDRVRFLTKDLLASRPS